MTSKKDFSKGMIYKIEPVVDHEDGDIYIGSTTKSLLSQRMTTHRYDYNQWQKGGRHLISSFTLFDKYGISNCRIILLEAVNVDTLDKLKAKEAFYIQSLRCVNKNGPLRLRNEYLKENEIKIKEKRREYDIKNIEKIRDKDKEKRKIKIECVCGSIYCKRDKSEHEKTKKHLTFIK